MTDAYLHSKVNHKNYEILFDEFANEVLRLNLQYLDPIVQTEEVPTENSNKRVGVIFIENDYKFMLLRQQSLYNSMHYSNYIGAKLSLWNNRDSDILGDIIARIGIPLEEAKQQYKYMQHKYKLILKDKMMEVAQKFGLHDILYRSFVRQIDSKVQITAADMVYCLSAILEFPPNLLDKYMTDFQNKLILGVQEKSFSNSTERSKNFWCAFDALDRKSLELIDQGIMMALDFQKALVDEGSFVNRYAAAYLLERRELCPAKTFRYAVLKNETLNEKKFFTHPQSLQKLALLLMEIYKVFDVILREKEQRQKSVIKPIILCSQVHKGDTYMVIGIVGAQSFGSSDKNHFGHHFMKVVNDQGLQFKQDNFETSIIEIQKDDFIPFLDELLEQG